MTDQPWKNPSTKLVSILEEYGISGFNVPGGTDKNTIHNYTGIYETILAPFVGKHGKLLEIGVQHGGSSLLWQKYLSNFTVCMVDLVDIVHPWIWQCMDQNPNEYIFYENDAYNETFVDLLTTEWCGFDVIIDDGPHTLESQLFAVKHFLPLLNEGGVFAIEDIQDISHIQLLTDAVPDDLKPNVFTYDVRDTKGRYDDVIFTVSRTIK